MNLSKVNVFLATLFLTTPFVYSNDWKTTSSELISKGEFEKVHNILNNHTDSADFIVVDSITKVMERIKRDFNLTPEDGINKIKSLRPETTLAEITKWKENKYIESMVIDDKEWWFRRAVHNLWLLNPEFAKENNEKTIKYLECVQDVKKSPADNDGIRNWHSVKIKYTFTVNPDAVPAGETIKAWIPFPMETMRQRNVRIGYSNAPITPSVNSSHNTIYMEQVAEAGQPTEFVVTFTYEVGAQYFDFNEILNNLKPYNKNSEIYKKYTASQLPHININHETTKLAKKIVGEEKNPAKQALMIYKWIVQKYPWASARDYSTIECIPSYVVNIGHGDCGQVSLLYIALTRSLGIPSRWESGRMLHPWDVNLHDWAETYFEGIGWVPTDVSVGRNKNDEVCDFYFSGTDMYRMAANDGFGGEFIPRKKFIRSETVDSQTGEAEWKGGNLETNQWKSRFEIVKMEKIEN